MVFCTRKKDYGDFPIFTPRKGSCPCGEKSYTATKSLNILQQEVGKTQIPVHSVFKCMPKRISPEKLLEYFSDRARSIPDKEYRFWQPDSDVRLIQTEDALCQKLDYIHHNPIQESWRLVDEPADYPFSSCRFHEKGLDWNGVRIENVLMRSAAEAGASAEV